MFNRLSRIDLPGVAEGSAPPLLTRVLVTLILLGVVMLLRRGNCGIGGYRIVTTAISASNDSIPTRVFPVPEVTPAAPILMPTEAKSS